MRYHWGLLVIPNAVLTIIAVEDPRFGHHVEGVPFISA